MSNPGANGDRRAMSHSPQPASAEAMTGMVPGTTPGALGIDQLASVGDIINTAPDNRKKSNPTPSP